MISKIRIRVVAWAVVTLHGSQALASSEHRPSERELARMCREMPDLAELEAALDEEPGGVYETPSLLAMARRCGVDVQGAMERFYERLASAEGEQRSAYACAIAGAGEAPPAAIADTLRRWTTDARPDVRGCALRSLVSTGAEPPSFLARGLVDESAEVRQAAAYAAARLAREQPEARAVLAEALASPYADVKLAAIQSSDPAALGSAAEPLRSLLDDADLSVRLAAAGRLEDERDPTIVERRISILREGLAAADPELRGSAIAQVGELGPRASALAPTVVDVLLDGATEPGRASSIGYALARLGPEAKAAVTDRLRDALSGPAGGRALTALDALDVDLRSSVDDLIGLLDRTAPEEQRQVIGALTEIGPAAAAAVPKLVELARTHGDPPDAERFFAEESRSHGDREEFERRQNEWELARRAISALGKMGKAGKDAIPTLERALDAGDADFEHAAAEALTSLGYDRGKLVERWVEQVQSGDAKARARALGLLGSVDLAGREAALPALREAAGSGSADARTAAIRAMWSIERDPDATLALVDGLAHDGDPAVRKTVPDLLAGLGGSIAARSVPLLRTLLGDSSPEVRQAAASSTYSLGRLNEDLVPELTAMLAGPAEDAEAAAGALARIGEAAKGSLPALRAAAARFPDSWALDRALETLSPDTTGGPPDGEGPTVPEPGADAEQVFWAAYQHSEAGNLAKASSLFARARELWVAADDSAGGARASVALGELEQKQGHADDARSAFERALELNDQADEPDVGLRGAVLGSLGWLALQAGDDTEAEARFRASLEEHEAAGSVEGQAIAAFQLAQIAERRGDAGETRRLYERALGLFRRSDNAIGEGFALYGLAQLDGHAGALDRARERFETALTLFRQGGAAEGEGEVELARAPLASKEGRLTDALAHMRAGREAFERAKSPIGVAAATTGVAAVESMLGERAAARKHLIEAEKAFAEASWSRGLAIVHRLRATLDLAAGELDEVRDGLDRALAASRAVNDRPGTGAILTQLAGLHLRRGRPDLARRALTEAEPLVAGTLDHGAEIERLTGLAELERVAGHVRPAREALEAARALQLQTGDRFSATLVDVELAAFTARAGDLAAARAVLEPAAASFASAPAPAALALALERLGDLETRAGRLGRAMGHYTRLGEIGKKLGDDALRAGALYGLGRVERLRGHGAEARTSLAQAAELQDRLELHEAAAFTRAELAALSLPGRTDVARTEVDNLRTLAALLESPGVELLADLATGELELAAGRADAARVAFTRAETLGAQVGDALLEARARHGSARARLAAGDAAGARTALDPLVRSLEQMGAHLELAAVLTTRADAARAGGDDERSGADRERARALTSAASAEAATPESPTAPAS